MSYGVEKRRDHRNCVGGRTISVIPPLLNKEQADIKSICTEERGKKVMTATNMCSNFGGLGVVPPYEERQERIKGLLTGCGLHGHSLDSLILLYRSIQHI